MPEEIKTAQTTAHAEVDSDADVDKTKELVNEEEFDDPSRRPQGGNEAAKEPEAAQTKQQNSANARRRREAERQAELDRVRSAVREQTIIETLGGKNPYTNGEMKDHADVEEYLAMKEIAQNGGDPLSDYSKFQKQKERARIEQASKEEERDKWFREDREAFVTKYPDVDVQTLIQNSQFQKFASGKVGALPLSDIYEDFLEMTSEYEKKAKAIAKQMVANKRASPGNLAGTGTADGGYFTKDQVQRMTREEVHENYDRIRASMRKWK